MPQRSDDFTLVAADAIAARTDKAICLLLPDGKEAWIPLSLIDGEDDIPDDGGPVPVASWFVEREGLPLYEDDTPKRPKAGRPRPSHEPDLGRVTTKAFGPGRLLSDDGDRMTVRFADGKVRTLGARYVTKA